ncbi:hypothetical protein EK21DRAFT_61742, partial [Setomelanomma holmii]
MHKSRSYIWPLYRTLSTRPDLARQIPSINLDVTERCVTINPPSSHLFPGGVPFTPSVKLQFPEPAVAGALLQLLPEVQRLIIRLFTRHGSYPAGEEPLMEHCLSKLFPGFDPRTAHLTPILGLEEVHEIIWEGSAFHWALANLASLSHLMLERPCRILADEAPHEMNETLMTFDLVSRSSIFTPGTGQNQHLGPFLANFTALEHIGLVIYDSSHDDGDRFRLDDQVTPENQGSFSILLAK